MHMQNLWLSTTVPHISTYVLLTTNVWLLYSRYSTHNALKWCNWGINHQWITYKQLNYYAWFLHNLSIVCWVIWIDRSLTTLLFPRIFAFDHLCNMREMYCVTQPLDFTCTCLLRPVTNRLPVENKNMHIHFSIGDGPNSPIGGVVTKVVYIFV